MDRFFLIVQDVNMGAFSLHYKRQNLNKPEEVEENAIQLFVKENQPQSSIYPDVLEKPLFIVSDEFKRIAQLYNRQLQSSAVVITEGESQKVYWKLKTPILDCLAEGTQFNHANLITDVVLKKDIVSGQSLFSISNRAQNLHIVRYDLAESLLRRNLVGFHLKEVKLW